MKSFSLSSKKSISLNEFLREELPAQVDSEISNSKIRRLIVAGSVSVNGRQVRLPAFMLRTGSEILIHLDEEKLFFEKQPDDIAYDVPEKDILFEDESIIH